MSADIGMFHIEDYDTPTYFEMFKSSTAQVSNAS